MTERRETGSGATRPYLNTRQAAYRLCLSARTLEAMRSANDGPRFRRHGRLVFYHVDDLDAWSRGTADAACGSGDHD